MRLALILVSACAFIFYGILIIFSNHMKLEFERYKMKQFRTLTGYLEVAGGTGQIVGLFFVPILLTLASSGLALLMLMGTIVRIRTKDPWVEIIPAFSLFIINLYIAISENL